ncbi:MAG: thioredoxin family protein [Nitrospirota bacterium]
MVIKVLGPGSLNCQKLEEMVKVAVKELGVDATLVKITDIGEIVKYGIVSTPGLIVNGKVKHSGKLLPDMERIKSLIKEEM